MPGVVAVVTARDVMEWTTTLPHGAADRRFAADRNHNATARQSAFPGRSGRLRCGDRPLYGGGCSRDRRDRIRGAADSTRFARCCACRRAAGRRARSRAIWSRIRASRRAMSRRACNAHCVVEASFSQHRQTHLPIETRGCLAIWDEGREHLAFHIGNQVPHPLRTQLAARLRLSESQVTVISPDVGGGFGQKIALYREELTVAALARELRRPVRWREDRMENLQASCHAREQNCRVRAGVDARRPDSGARHSPSRRISALIASTRRTIWRGSSP